jgi:multidrug efflux system membrane fusion protein
MKPRPPRSRDYLLLAALAATLAGCGETHAPPNEPIVVVVSQPLQRKVTDYAYSTGQTEAMPSVEIRARVSGYLTKVAFVSGADVKKGQLLFEIDPAPYKAALDRAEAAVESAKASATRQEAEFARSQRLIGGAAISREDFEKSSANRDEAVAALAQNRANLDSAKLDYGWTKVTAPFAGQASRNLIDIGNLVEKDKTVLTTIVATDPIYAYFDADDLTYQRFNKLILEGKLKSYKEAEFPVFMSLPDEQGFPHKGVIDFVNNKVNTGTGTVQVRGKFPNKDRAITPGLFVRVRVPAGDPRKAILVAETALGSDQGQKYLLVVNDKNQVVRRNVALGVLNDGLYEVLQGLGPDEWVITDGLLRVRPGLTVNPTRAPMPTLPGAGANDKVTR